MHTKSLGTEVRLASDNGPVYHALLTPSEAGVADQEQVRSARIALGILEDVDPGAIRACEGLGLRDAREKLINALVRNDIITQDATFL